MEGFLHAHAYTNLVLSWSYCAICTDGDCSSHWSKWEAACQWNCLATFEGNGQPQVLPPALPPSEWWCSKDWFNGTLNTHARTHTYRERGEHANEEEKKMIFTYQHKNVSSVCHCVLREIIVFAQLIQFIAVAVHIQLLIILCGSICCCCCCCCVCRSWWWHRWTHGQNVLDSLPTIISCLIAALNATIVAVLPLFLFDDNERQRLHQLRDCWKAEWRRKLLDVVIWIVHPCVWLLDWLKCWGCHCIAPLWCVGVVVFRLFHFFCSTQRVSEWVLHNEYYESAEKNTGKYWHIYEILHFPWSTMRLNCKQKTEKNQASNEQKKTDTKFWW